MLLLHAHAQKVYTPLAHHHNTTRMNECITFLPGAYVPPHLQRPTPRPDVERHWSTFLGHLRRLERVDLTHTLIVGDTIGAYLLQLLNDPSIPSELTAFLRPRLIETFLVCLALPPPWIANRHALIEHLEPLLSNEFSPTSRTGIDYFAFMSQLFGNLRTNNGAHVPRIMHTITILHHLAKHAAVQATIDSAVRAMRFTCMVRENQRRVVCLLGSNPGVYAAAGLPKAVCSLTPEEFTNVTSALRMDHYYLIISTMPPHVPGLALERTFAAAVYGDPDTPCLHQALTRTLPRWIRLWRAQSWPADAHTQRKLLGLGDWHLAPEDARKLLTWNLDRL